MALADYQLCCVCGNKTFYDANLNWEHDDSGGVAQPLGTARPGYLSGMKLDRTGSLGAICVDCFQKGHRLKVVQQAKDEDAGA